MSQMLELNLRPDDRILRQFGFIALAGFAFLAACAHFEILLFAAVGESKTIFIQAFGILAAACLVFSLVYPRANLPIYIGLTILAYPIGFVLSYVIMGLLFFGLIGPLAIFFRIIGRDSMHRRYAADEPSYWSEPRPPRGRDSYFRQY